MQILFNQSVYFTFVKNQLLSNC